MSSERSAWQARDGRTAAVLECVFMGLGARELARCGRVCVAWRRAARSAPVWRHALLPCSPPRALRALARTALCNRHIDSWASWSWVREGMLSLARWERRSKLVPAASAPLVHAALDSTGTCLALLSEDAHLSIWKHGCNEVEGGHAWREHWGGAVSAEWRSAVSVQWAPHARRLLVAGTLLLADRWEVVVVTVDEDFSAKVACRAACSLGTATCWMDDDAFLTLRLQLLAPGHAVTTVSLNAADQETHSEHTGVVMPLLRIYNEASANITHILIVDVSSTADLTEETCDEEGISTPNVSYFRCLRTGGERCTMLIAAGGECGGPRGEARALLGWCVPRGLRVPPLFVCGDLRERVRRSRARAPSPPLDLPEQAVRALCTPPAATCTLPAIVLGLASHPNGACVWARSAAGLTCVSLPDLHRVLHLPAPQTAAPFYRLQPALDHDYIITPLGGGSGDVAVWTARSTRRSAQVLQHASCALLVLLRPARPAQPAPPGALDDPSPSCLAPSTSREMLVLAGDAVHVWQSWIPETEDYFLYDLNVE